MTRYLAVYGTGRAAAKIRPTHAYTAMTATLHSAQQNGIPRQRLQLQIGSGTLASQVGHESAGLRFWARTK
jgi:hypothetical protein